MRVIADFQLHSKYSRATSKNTTPENLAEGARLKGLQMLGTGDFTHPSWLSELKDKLEPIDGANLFKYQQTFFMLTGEFSTIYEEGGKTRKVHHMIHAPSFEIVEQINEKLSKYGNLKADARPIILASAPQVVEELMEISKDIFIYPAHAWTPWFGALGSKSGFDSVEDCYKDQVKHISAIETGLSSDPAMNWRVSSLDKFALLSSSDAHSPNPWRLGREANAFELGKVTYDEIIGAIKKKDPKKFIFTIEVDPNYGKYHYDGHAKCGVSMKPSESKSLSGICPKCRKKMTIGVLARVEQLADRNEGYTPKDAVPFKTLLPLYEVVSFALGVKQLYSKKVFEEQKKLVEKFGNELNVLLNADKDELMKVANEKVVDAITKIRNGTVRFQPGYDGEYGQPIFDESIQITRSFANQKTLTEF
jgi:uncharacterized protein (TIGR00375 family)